MIAAGGLAAALLLASAAHGDEPAEAPATTQRERRAGLETSLYAGGGVEETPFGTSEGHYVTLALLGTLDVDTSDHVRFELRLPLVLSHAEVIDRAGGVELQSSGSAAEIGNPFLGFFHRGGDERKLVLIGGGATLPFASVPDTADGMLDADEYAAATSLNIAAQMRGSTEAWLYRPDTVSLVGRAGYEHHAGYVAGIEGALAVFLPRGDEGSVESLVQLALRFGGLSLDGKLDFGMRLQAVWVPTAGGDNAQLSAAPYTRLTLDRAYLLADLLLDIDEPSGFAFANGGVWSLTLGGGVSW